jgi:hypothetical protein
VCIRACCVFTVPSPLASLRVRSHIYMDEALASYYDEPESPSPSDTPNSPVVDGIGSIDLDLLSAPAKRDEKLMIGPEIELPPEGSVTANGGAAIVGEVQNKLTLALMPALQELMYALEKQERRKKKKTRKGKKLPYDIEPLSFLAEHLLKNNTDHNRHDADRVAKVKGILDEFNLKAGILRESQEMTELQVRKAQNRYVHKLQRAEAIKIAASAALAAKERRSPKNRRALLRKRSLSQDL